LLEIFEEKQNQERTLFMESQSVCASLSESAPFVQEGMFDMDIIELVFEDFFLL